MKYRCPALLGSLAFLAYMPGASAAPGPFCDITLTPSDSIQAAVDWVGEGGVVCLGDGTHVLSTPIGIELNSAHTGLTLRAVEGASPILETPGSVGIQLIEADDITISRLTFVGQAINKGRAIHILGSDNVAITHNEFRLIQGSVGVFSNSNGVVLSDNNMVDNIDSVHLWFCTGCSAIRNQFDVVGPAIRVHAGNSFSDGEEIIRGTKISENQIIAAGAGIVVTVRADVCCDRRNVFVSTEVLSIQQNQITARNPIQAIASVNASFSLDPPATAKIKNLGVIRNEIVCVPFFGNENGVVIGGFPERMGIDVASVENTKIIRNTFSGCPTDVLELGTVERTALSPDLRELLDFLDAATAEGGS